MKFEAEYGSLSPELFYEISSDNVNLRETWINAASSLPIIIVWRAHFRYLIGLAEVIHSLLTTINTTMCLNFADIHIVFTTYNYVYDSK